MVTFATERIVNGIAFAVQSFEISETLGDYYIVAFQMRFRLRIDFFKVSSGDIRAVIDYFGVVVQTDFRRVGYGYVVDNRTAANNGNYFYLRIKPFYRADK